MSLIGGERVRPFYLSGRSGPLYAVYHPPQRAAGALGDVLVVPAFAEEMNRCRAMITIQARQFAQLGIGTLVLDPYGTGDSGGEFSEGSWSSWAEDLRCGIEWLRREANGCRMVWGVRLGALMASELAASDPDIARLLLWQPVLDGKSYLTQFLRIRIAAEIEQSGGIKTTEELRRASVQGEPVEVSGYQLGPALVRELDQARFADPRRLSTVEIAWCEVQASPDAAVPRASQKLIDECRAAGVVVAFERVTGPPFWQVHERAVAPELIGATSVLATGSAPQVTKDLTSEAPRGAPKRPAAAQATTAVESPVTFSCADEELVGILHRGGRDARRGIIIVVAGGPQYRAGAHRQFVSLARKLAAAGYPVLRFDLRGMGDSTGEHIGFEHSEADIRAAIDVLGELEPRLEEFVLFGECESASGILFYAYRDPRVRGIVLVNPWVRTEGGRAEVIIKHYYLNRMLSGAFWRKVCAGEFDLRTSVRDLVVTAGAYLRGRALRRRVVPNTDQELASLPLPLKTAAGLRRFKGSVMILMSGHDYIAREFDEVVKSSAAWKGLLEDARVCRRDLPGADHTFSRESWKRQASDWVCQWVASW